jgi:hypothetical protein
MSKQRQQSTTSYPVNFLMVDSADHITGKTGLSVTVTLSKNGGAFGAPSGAVSEISNGWYSLVGNAADRGTLGELLIHATAAGADPTDDTYEIVTDDPFAGNAAGMNTKLDTIDDFLDTEVAAIKAKTDNLPSDPADASDLAASFATVNTKLDTIDDFLDTEIAAIKAKTDNLPSDPADASDLAASFATVNTKLDTIDDFLDTEVAAIKAKTDLIPGDPAGAADIAAEFAVVNGTLATIAGYVDTEVAAIKAKTDLLPSDPADASDIASSFSTVNTKLDTIDDFLDTEVAAIKAKTDQLVFTTANQVDARTFTNDDKTGYALSSAGLDAVAAPADLANDADARSSFAKMVRALFNRFYGRVTQTSTQQKIYNDSGTLISTATVSDDGVTQEKAKSA